MIYYVLRFYAMLGLWVNFRKVYVEHRERIPEGNHVIFALNHPTAFIDPIAVGTHVDPACWFILRGDKFVTPFVRWFLRQIQNVPIYRESDGVQALRGNVTTMAKVTEEVVRGEPTVILCEGRWSPRRRVHRVQRGTARMLFQAHKKDTSKPVAIVPTGITYTDANAFRSTLTISYGEPIYAADYAAAYAEDSRAATDAVSAVLRERIGGLIVRVDDKRNDGLVERLLPILQHDYPDPGFPPTAERSPFHAAQRGAVERINGMDAVELNAVRYDLDAYEKALERAGVSDSGLAVPSYGSLPRAVGLWSLGPLAVVALLLHYPLAAIIQRYTVRTVESEQFFGSVRYGLGLGAFLVYALVLTAVGAFAVGWFCLLLPPLLLAAAYFYLLWSESFALWRASARARNLPPETREHLLALRADLIERLGVQALAGRRP